MRFDLQDVATSKCKLAHRLQGGRQSDGPQVLIGDSTQQEFLYTIRHFVCVARFSRGILDQDFLVLDEATSHMDPYTERLVTGAVQRLLQHKTLIIIAHRLSTIRNVDKILMVSGGELKEQGTHEELMALGGLYAAYYKLQSGMSAAASEEGQA